MRNYKNGLVTLATFFIGTCLALGQLPQSPKIKEMQIGYYTQKIPLTTPEAQRFWPIFNTYSEEIEKLQQEMKLKSELYKMKIDEMDEGEISAASLELIEFKQKRLAVIEKYYPKFQEALPAKKLLKFYYAEEAFPRWVLQKIRQQGANNRPQRNRW